jgi:hypothetical protein
MSLVAQEFLTQFIQTGDEFDLYKIALQRRQATRRLMQLYPESICNPMHYYQRPQVSYQNLTRTPLRQPQSQHQKSLQAQMSI